MEIAVYLDDDRNIVNVNDTSDIAAEKQANEKGWKLIQNSDPTFSINEMYKWTVRESDGLLVHKSTGLTPDEEKTQTDALLGKTVGTALATANTASQKADNAIAALALLGKQIAVQNTSTNGGTK